MPKYFPFVLMLLYGLLGTVHAQYLPPDYEEGYSDLNWSPRENVVSLSMEDEPGLYLADLEAHSLLKIAHGEGAAYQASWSYDGRFLAFKYFRQDDGIILQAPAVYDLESGELKLLLSFSRRVGIPSWTPDNQLILSDGNRLLRTDKEGTVLAEYTLPAYSNQTPVSPSGEYVIYNDGADRLNLLNLSTGETGEVSLPAGGYFEPEWSPDGKAFSCRSLNGELFVYELATGKYRSLGDAQNAVWGPDGKWLYVSRLDAPREYRVDGMMLFRMSRDGTQSQILVSSDQWADFPAVSPAGKKLIFADRYRGELVMKQLSTAGDVTASAAMEQIDFRVHSSIPVLEKSASLSKVVETDGYYFDIPYLNQVYDLPDWFDGFWACGGTSAVMCLGYYGLLEQWPLDVWSPYFHIVDYSHYICEIYDYNGYTFQIGGQDRNGSYGYGAYGYIIQNNWEDTRGHMAEYARKHGLDSQVDWEPNRQKSVHQSDQKMPFVLLNSLTSSGHYISVIGYSDDGTTLIVNDPYGDKNQGYYNYYGRRVRYDWPGYNNGNANLKTVWCFIYFQGELPADLLSLRTNCSVDTSETGQPLTLTGRVTNIGNKSVTNLKISIAMDEQPEYYRNSMVLDSFRLAALNPGDTLDLSRDITLPDSLFSNQYYLGFLVDADSAFGEMLEDNNYHSAGLSVYGYPNIYGYAPADSSVLTSPDPVIYATYRDLMGSIDTSRIQLILDGIDVTAECSKSLRKITYKPDTPMTDGEHQVQVRVTNEKGYIQTTSWMFSIDTQTGVSDGSPVLAGSLRLEQNYPNPFNGQTRISFTLPEAGNVSLYVYDMSGSRVRVLADGFYPNGGYSVVWNGTNTAGRRVSSGIYIARLKSGSMVLSRRMLYIK